MHTPVARARSIAIAIACSPITCPKPRPPSTPTMPPASVVIRADCPATRQPLPQVVDVARHEAHAVRIVAEEVRLDEAVRRSSAPRPPRIPRRRTSRRPPPRWRLRKRCVRQWLVSSRRYPALVSARRAGGAALHPADRLRDDRARRRAVRGQRLVERLARPRRPAPPRAPAGSPRRARRASRTRRRRRGARRCARDCACRARWSRRSP